MNLTDSPSPFAELDAQGLNLQAVFEVAKLPENIAAALRAGAPYRQLLLIGHGGGLLWRQLQRAGMQGAHPIDDFSRAQVAAWLQSHYPGCRHQFLYPGPPGVSLQGLGQLAGWHHPSPFMVGINARWGSWFAYRALLLADTELPPTQAATSASPCASCASRACVSACPADALRDGFDLAACLAYRQQPGSACQDRCLARNACPVGDEQRYSEAQISYHYGRSMRHLSLHSSPAKTGDPA